ncbi:hypothetical protein TNIN_436761 [Trichonephila inaurata madagascariensis]|uniref:Uncharacterized protein n=1 Tax=Trichonephila inaurata madagascariensis TaxID=2747483 RepID=A0A8X6Y3N9_9ARAC|nr:hypothetical protein TNIN_436761 [Trichonephila inaurata madagascariensis]
MAACRPKRVVTSDEIDKFLTKKETGDEFSDASSDNEVGNNRQKQGLASGGQKTMSNNETIVNQLNV